MVVGLLYVEETNPCGDTQQQRQLHLQVVCTSGFSEPTVESPSAVLFRPIHGVCPCGSSFNALDLFVLRWL